MKHTILWLLVVLCAGCAQNIEEVTTYHVKRNCYMDSRHHHQLTIDIQMDIPTSMRDHEQLVRVQRSIVSQVLGENYAGMVPIKALENYCMDLRRDYLADSRKKVLGEDYIHGDYDRSVCWKSRICYLKRNLLSVEAGKHYFSMDMRTGSVLKLDDIISDKLALEQVLGRTLTDNFCICDGALLFCFSSSDGEVEKASVQLSAVREYLRSEWWWLAFGFA